MNSVTHEVMLNSQGTTKMIIKVHVLCWHVKIKALQLHNDLYVTIAENKCSKMVSIFLLYEF